MRLLILVFLMVGSLAQAQSNQNFHSFKVKNIFGDSISLSSYSGKKLLVVNTASFCGYTYQFSKLQKLDSMYQDQNFEVIGFPCNDFGGQDPYADSTINTFCQNEYGVTFPMMSRIEITTGDTSMVYKWLQKKSLNGVQNVSVSWNFNKFLIDENGHWVRHYFSPTEPNDPAIINWIMSTTTQTSKSIPFQNLSIVNPSAAQLQIKNLSQSELPIQLHIVDIQGKKMASLSLDAIDQKLPDLDLQPGLYLVQLSGKAGSRCIKWLVEAK
jgi:glutathione peroxidase